MDLVSLSSFKCFSMFNNIFERCDLTCLCEDIIFWRIVLSTKGELIFKVNNAYVGLAVTADIFATRSNGFEAKNIIYDGFFYTLCNDAKLSQWTAGFDFLVTNSWSSFRVKNSIGINNKAILNVMITATIWLSLNLIARNVDNVNTS